MSQTDNIASSSSTDQSRRASWFNDMVAQLRVDEIQLETNTASKEKRERYDVLMNSSPEDILQKQQEIVTRHFVTKLLVDFLRESKPHWPRISRLAASANDAEVLMWIELKAEDELLEDQLTMIEASVNSRYHDLGYDLDFMVVEAEDEIPVPEHYALIPIANEPLSSTPKAS